MSNHSVKISRLFSRLVEKPRRYRGRLTRTKLVLFALTLIVFGIALGGLDTHNHDETVTSKVMLLSIPNRLDFGLLQVDSSLEPVGDVPSLKADRRSCVCPRLRRAFRVQERESAPCADTAPVLCD